LKKKEYCVVRGKKVAKPRVPGNGRVRGGARSCPNPKKGEFPWGGRGSRKGLRGGKGGLFFIRTLGEKTHQKKERKGP